MALVEQNILNSKTVFILSAGASKPFNFPLGSELKQQMLSQLENEYNKKVLNSVDFDNRTIHEFHKALSYTSHPTIDIFLEKKRKFREIGAYVIAQALIPCENDLRLFPQRDWYGDLFTILDFENEQSDLSFLLLYH